MFSYRIFFKSFSGSKQNGDIFRKMERIGDKESAIAERVRALLAAANNTAAAVAAVPATNPAVPAVAVPRDPRRLDPGADPARVVANLTAAGIQLAVSIIFFCKRNWLICILPVILSQNPTGMFNDDIRTIHVQSGSGTAKHGSWMIFVGVKYPDKVPCDRLTNPELLPRVRLLELCHEYLFFKYRARELTFFRIQIRS
jgi:hypothetical protein